MEHQIVLDSRIIPYTLLVSPRLKRIKIAVKREKGLVVSIPKHSLHQEAITFMMRKSTWILTRLDTLPPIRSREEMEKEYHLLKEKAYHLIQKKCVAWNLLYGFSYKKISIKNQKTRWGSCSRKGNLNFSYKIVFLQEELVDYIVVHELCHLGEFNHSPLFWKLVAKALPDYTLLRKQLQGKSLI